MINNAGTGGTEIAGKIHEMDEEMWDATMCAPFSIISPKFYRPTNPSFAYHHYRKINARSVFLGCKYAIKQFLSQDIHPSGHRGWIINTASMLGLVGLKPSAGAYWYVLS